MLEVDLKKEHKLFDGANENESINYQGAGMAFLKKDYSEKLAYCEDLDREEAQVFFNQPDDYYFGECSLEWVYTAKPTMGRGKVSMFFAKYYKNGYFDQPFD
ncbi:MAG TPA: hypothetical protein EYG73_03040 [Arcobacter sp.]|nr:hypothetical protein [Arcobacter sp.]